MTPEIRRAALRMAAKTAFVASIGCSGGQAPRPTSNIAPANGSAVADCATYLGGLASVDMDGVHTLASTDPLHDKPGVYGAFVDLTVRGSARTHECCNEELAKGAGAPHRWACCSAVDNVVPAGGGAACTPWGPPCPPEMT